MSAIDFAACRPIEVTIPNGAARPTTGVNVEGFRSGTVIFPSGWDAADLTFEVAYDDNQYRTADAKNPSPPSYVPMHGPTGTLLRITNVAVSKAFAIPAGVLEGARFLKVASTNTASTADVNQTAARVLRIILKS